MLFRKIRSADEGHLGIMCGRFILDLTKPSLWYRPNPTGSCRLARVL